MTNHQKTYFFPPTWEIPPPPTGTLTLGALLTSPSSPTTPLNRPLPTSPLNPLTTTKTSVTYRSASSQTTTLTLFTTFLSFLTGAGADLSLSQTSSTQSHFAFDALDTISFDPTPEYISQSIAAAPAALTYLSKSRFRKALYMVTAINIARGARMRTVRIRGKGVEVVGEVDGTAVGAMVGAGVGVEREWERGEEGAFEGGDDFVFAFRVKKVVVKRGGKVKGVEEFTKGAMYDAEVKGGQAGGGWVVAGVEEVGQGDVGVGGECFSGGVVEDDGEVVYWVGLSGEN